jgi:hypothetical protein
MKMAENGPEALFAMELGSNRKGRAYSPAFVGKFQIA